MRFKIPKQQPANFRASALYLSGHAKGQSPDRVEWVKGYNLGTTEPSPAAAVMEATASQNRRCKNKAYHVIVSFDPKDAKGGKLDPDIMKEIADEVMERFGMAEHQALVYAHKDTDHPHLHFLVNRIHQTEKKALSRHNEGIRLKELCQDIAKERGLNIAKDWDKEISREIDEERSPTDGEYWQAKKEERLAESPLGRDDVKDLREKSRSHFLNSKDWRELTIRLAAEGASLERKGQGLILMTDDGYAKLSQMGKQVRLKDMEERFGESFDDWMKRFGPELADQANNEYLPQGHENMTPAELRRAERLERARKGVERKRGDKLAEFTAAEEQYIYWRGVNAFVKYKVRQLKRGEIKKALSLKKRHDARRRFRKAHGDYFDELAEFFRDPKQADKDISKLILKHGRKKAMDMMLKKKGYQRYINPDSVEPMKQELKRLTKKHMQKLFRARGLFEETRFKLMLARERLYRSRMQYKNTYEEFHKIKDRFWTRYTHREILVDALQRQQKAMERYERQNLNQKDMLKARKAVLNKITKRQKKEMDRARGKKSRDNVIQKIKDFGKWDRGR